MAGKPLQLVLKGYCDDGYTDHLLQLAALHGVQERVRFIGFTPYEEVPAITASCDIGIAIFARKDVMNNTLGTASNKIYEYAAAGLPVICLENSPVAVSLAAYEWVIPVALNSEAILNGLEKIAGCYEKYSKEAHDSFMEKLNFGYFFRDVAAYAATMVL